MADEKHGVALYFRHGVTTIVSVQNPWVFIAALTRQLSDAKSTTQYWADEVTGPLLICVTDLVAAIPVGKDDTA